MQGLGSFVPLILLIVVFYFLLIRPQRKRQQEQLQMQNSLTPGSRVMTTTGLFGTVSALEDDDVVLEIAPGVQTRWTKGAIGRVVTPVEPAAVPVDNEEDGVRDTVADETVIDTPERRGDEGPAGKQI
ncbi:preprotein translocase subunit YajC [Sphaerisporangium rufum]|uniref:Preprotein translocase subunit YajC n=1 Tax=Sphaerisporangium rufum TaxID=1381558 RepID=A0A919R9C6_9ACTN|nr:preprotein translocase subunit YajC [Sphaerisporangium rufum]GII80836.1 preprotein translocase subunit YajC [Sphaerisporangium rufum]